MKWWLSLFIFSVWNFYLKMMLSYDSQVHVTGPIHIYIVFSSMSFIWEQKDQLRLQEDKMRELTDALNKQVEENRYNNYDTQLTKSTCQVFKELL